MLQWIILSQGCTKLHFSICFINSVNPYEPIWCPMVIYVQPALGPLNPPLAIFDTSITPKASHWGLSDHKWSLIAPYGPPNCPLHEQDWDHQYHVYCITLNLFIWHLFFYWNAFLHKLLETVSSLITLLLDPKLNHLYSCILW